MPYTQDDLTPGSTWRHTGRGSTYTVEGLTTCSTNGPGDGVVCVSYVCHAGGQRYHRELSEFLDGRFERVHPP